MVGGDDDAVAQVEPVFRDLAPEDGYAHVGAAGAGHFVKMVHNGIEYGLMQAYAEGFEVMEKSEFDLDLHEIAGIWRYGSVVRSWLLELLVQRVREGRDASREDPRLRRGLGRGPLDDPRGDGRGRAGAGDHRGALRAVRVAPGRVVRREGERGAPQPVRRPRGRGGEVGMAATVDANPLAEGLQLRRRPDPCILVDLRRVGRPDVEEADAGALLARATAACCPRSSGSSAPRAARSPTSEFPERMKQAVKDHARDPFDEEVWDEARRRDALRHARLRRRHGRGRARRDAQRARQGAGHGR